MSLRSDDYGSADRILTAALRNTQNRCFWFRSDASVPPLARQMLESDYPLRKAVCSACLRKRQPHFRAQAHLAVDHEPAT